MTQATAAFPPNRGSITAAANASPRRTSVLEDGVAKHGDGAARAAARHRNQGE